jgi:adenosylcobinamide-GDP ribazoletransferase
MLTDLRGAFGLLTRLPVGSCAIPPDLARCVWAFPVVGLVVNGIAAVVFAAGVPPLLGAAWALVVTMLLTGALHEDGLADTADGFGGGRTPARKLEIMRDSRIGSFGALALVMSLLVRVSAVAATPHPALALIAAGILGRGAMILPLLLLPPARPDGMGATAGHPPRPAAALGLALSAGAAWLVLGGRPAIAAVIAAAGAGLVVAGLAWRQIGGHTGDVLGAAEILSECVVLTAATLAISCA